VQTRLVVTLSDVLRPQSGAYVQTTLGDESEGLLPRDFPQTTAGPCLMCQGESSVQGRRVPRIYLWLGFPGFSHTMGSGGFTNAARRWCRSGKGVKANCVILPRGYRRGAVQHDWRPQQIDGVGLALSWSPDCRHIACRLPLGRMGLSRTNREAG